MRVRSNQEVHIRTGDAFRRAGNKKGVLLPGFELEVREVVQGESIDGRDQWYKDFNGDYYWSGGFGDAVTTYDYAASLTSIHKLAVDGNGVKVAIIDTGITALPEFNGHIDETLTRRYLKETNFFSSSDDMDGHGTALASLISCSEQFSVAPKAELVVCKVAVGRFSVPSNQFDEALEWCINQPEISVINCSLGFDNPTPKMNALIEAATQRNKIIVASSGLLPANPLVVFPARIPIVLGIGTVDKSDIAHHQNVLTGGLDFCAPGIGMETIGRAGQVTTNEIGSSISAAYFSGVVALCLSALTKHSFPIPTDAARWIFNEVSKCARRKGKSEYGNGIIDPLATIQTILNP